MEDACLQWRIVPEVIANAPKLPAAVTWKNGATAEMGNMLTPTQVKDQPEVKFQHDESFLYTIVMTDPDVPKEKAEIIHWMMTDVKNGDSGTGKTHAKYIRSGAPLGTGIHRYILLVYQQPPGYTPTEPYRPRNRERRPRWSVKRFAEENNLGDPVAGNFYRAEYDSYVPILHAELDAATPP